MTEFSKNFQKACVWPILSISGKIQIFLQNWAPSLFSPYDSLTSCTISKKIMIEFRKKSVLRMDK